MAIFSSAYLKLKRAGELIEELRGAIAEHTKTCVASIDSLGLQHPEDGSNPWAEWQIKLLPFPPAASILIGDIIHNARTSLDHMASELARLNKEPDKNVYFPFAENKGGLEEQIRNRKFNKCGKDAVDLLRTFEPYRGGNLILRALHDLDVMDKHKALVPTAEARFAKIQMQSWKAAPDLKEVFYVFPKDTDLAGRPVIETLEELVGLCEGILKAFVALELARDAGGDEAGYIGAEAEPRYEVLYFHARIASPPREEAR